MVGGGSGQMVGNARMMALSRGQGLGCFPSLFPFSGEEEQERTDSGILPSLCLSGPWPFPPGPCLLKASHLSLPSCLPPSRAHLNFALSSSPL